MISNDWWCQMLLTNLHETTAAFVSLFISVIEDSSGGYWLIVAAAAVSLLPLTCFCCWCILCLVGMRRRRKKGVKDLWGAPYPRGKPEKLQQIHYATTPPMVTVQVCSSECREKLNPQIKYSCNVSQYGLMPCILQWRHLFCELTFM